MYKPNIFTFKVDDQHRIYPQFNGKVDVQAFQNLNKITLQIYGEEDSSLIAINSVADFFENLLDANTKYEWNFIKKEYSRSNELLAIVIENCKH